MGVPVITLAGNTHVSRVGVSLLTNVGLDSCVAASAEEYGKLAISLAANTKKLQEIRMNLRQNMLVSPLMKAKEFAIHLENTYTELWQNCVADLQAGTQEAAAAFDVAAGLAEAAQKQKEGDLPAAEFLYRKVLSVDNQNIGALHEIGMLLFQRGRFEEAIGFLAQAVRILPNSFALVYNLALLYKENSQLEQALNMFTKAQQMNAKHLGAAINLARTYKELGKAEQSVEFYQMALKISPENVDIVTEFANVMSLCGRGSQAIALLQQAMQKEPQQADVLESLGFAFKVNGDAAKALEYYRAAVTVKPRQTA